MGPLLEGLLKMTELNEELSKVVEYTRAVSRTPLSEVKGFKVPKGVDALLSFSNGFITKKRVFRVFGVTADERIPSVEAWNNAEWTKSYGSCLRDVVLICDDIFGDQYGYRFAGEERAFVKFYCEGGIIEEIPGGINEFIEGLLNGVGSHLLDGDLLKKAFEAGLQPSANEHLAFELPLIVGGEASVDNLTIETVSLHLGTLSQLTKEGRRYPEGRRIRRFE